MKSGLFFYVVGPSGAGKDSLIDGARLQLPDDALVFAKRVITRPPGKPGEDYDSCTEEEFVQRKAQGEFLITWGAHGLFYGLPKSLLVTQQSGQHIIANGSRGVAEQIKALVPGLVFIEITAPVELLAKRIAQRGRETEQEISQRLSRQVSALPADVSTYRIYNDQSVDVGIERFVSTLLHVTALSLPGDKPRHKKLSGESLIASEMSAALNQINSGQLTTVQVNTFLIECCNRLSDDELVSVAKARALFMPRIEWPAPIVVDKHSLGGTPGSRVTMIVITIVAEHGLLIPKTSSRAITSAAGTADAMEVLSKVDLNREEVRKVTLAVNGCIAWNGRLNHSRLDDAMNAITRPLSLDTRRWSVASILSKKYSAGATHVVIDIPYSPTGKVKTIEDANSLGQLFERIGSLLGLTVKAFATKGDTPIGRGIGPGLEARDVLMVLSGDPKAPADLREKALFFAGHILAFDPVVGTYEAGRARAETLLDSGQAYARMQGIIDAQGRSRLLDWSKSDHTSIRSRTSGVVTEIDGNLISGLARLAGAPQDKTAGVYLHVTTGDHVREGDVLFDIYGADKAAVQQVVEVATLHHGILIH
jgi:thymidine phosphorylase